MKKDALTTGLLFLLKTYLFLMPWQTVWIIEERFLNGAKWEYGTLVLYAAEILFLVCLCVFIRWYWQKIKERQATFRVTYDRAIAALWLLLFAYIALSPLWALDRGIASQHSRLLMEAILAFWMFLLGPLTRREIIQWLAAGMILPSMLGIWQFLAQSTMSSSLLGIAPHPAWQAGSAILDGGEGRWLRAYGPYSHPNAFGGALALTLILFESQWKELSGKKMLQYSTLGILFTALFFTFSRSAWLAFGIWIAGRAALFFFKKQKICDAPLSLIIAIIAIIATLYWPLIQSRATASSPHEQASLKERQSGYSEAVQIIKQRPWIGVGPGNYTFALRQNYPKKPGWAYQPVHNIFLLMFAELGLVGIMLILAAIISSIIYHLSFITNLSPIAYRLSPIAIIPLALFDHYLYSSYAGLITGAIFFATVLNTKIAQSKNVPVS